MKTITGLLLTYALAVPAAPAAAQADWSRDIERHVERIADYALALAADALGDLVAEREQGRNDRVPRRDPDRARGRGPAYTDTFTRTVRLGRNGRLELDNLSGDVEVTGVGGDDVKIVATKLVRSPNEATARTALDAMHIEVTERPGLVSVSARPTRGRSGGAEVNYVITVPAGTSLSLKSVSGDVTVSKVSGDVQLNSLSGDVVVKDAKPRIVTVESVSGDVSLEQVSGERVNVNVISGDVVLSGPLASTGRYDLRSHSGDVQVILEGNPGFELEAGSFSGDVSSEFALTLRGAVRSSFSGNRGPGRNSDIRGTANDGGALLSLHSFSGDILITKR